MLTSWSMQRDDTCNSTTWNSLLDALMIFITIAWAHCMLTRKPESVVIPHCKKDILLRKKLITMNWKLLANKARALYYIKWATVRKRMISTEQASGTHPMISILGRTTEGRRFIRRRSRSLSDISFTETLYVTDTCHSPADAAARCGDDVGPTPAYEQCAE